MMSSTNYYVGLPGDKGLKKGSNAKGQTHSNIFGAVEPLQQTPKKNAPSSTIKNIITQDEKEAAEESNVSKENKAENGDAKTTPQRPRVPPGGFSSGFW